eukprot:CAMPEP_0197072576 /NCGR_PEP_ID=MMETSP1384-20130603/210168_1 /TAXON_ID=29189 /ORGANISM="Ammonia sp." /LENGTH=1087 /DNA_ID=CAMNT_0042511397 /DNA_START=88 /DNA_END=3351 /DNA_ORIENTATION=+
MACVDFTETGELLAMAETCTPNLSPFSSSVTNTTQCASEPSLSPLARFIISFHEYQAMAQHISSTKELLTNSTSIESDSFEILSRRNAVTTQYPTDFIVIHILQQKEQILSILNDSPLIKYTHIDKVITKPTASKHRRSKHLLETDQDLLYKNEYSRTGGKLFTKWMPFEEGDGSNRNLLSHFLITEHLGAKKLWDDGYDGSGVNVAVFDTGLEEHHSHFNHIDERTNWTDEDHLKDGIGHGTFCAGIIASKYKQCPGFAPNAVINTFRVFTNAQMSYTSWFLDAFNYAIYRKMNILNLSIGGPDWMDMPFVDKVREMQANNVIMITACGNDGKYGTINNPADQLSVIGVGGITQNDREIAGFQSRGMTTWELPSGYGRVKPDVVTVGQSLYGSGTDGGCRTLSGTSVASPVVAGVATLLSSVVPADERWKVINPASMKQVLVESADRIDGLRLYEQGNGKINLQNAYEYIKKYEKHVSAVPDSIDFTQCPHAWPFCRQPLYYSSQPYVFNMTLLNPFSVVGEIPKSPVFEINSIVYDNGHIIHLNDSKTNDANKYKFLNMEFKYSQRLWPWCGWLGIYIYAEESTLTALSTESQRKMTVTGTIKVDIHVMDTEHRAYNAEDEKWKLHKLSIPYSLNIIPTPPRNQRILWDQYHNLAYPLGYFPRDDLEKTNDMLDWFGDHLHTNYHTLYDFLKDKGYFVEILSTDYSCIDADSYSALVIVDTEDEFHAEELQKLKHDVLNNQLSVIVFADWYNEKLMQDVRFFDDNTRSLWDAFTGGANVVALNELLKPFQIQFGDMVCVGDVRVGKNKLYFQSGSTIMKSPAGSYVLKTDLKPVTDGRTKQVNSNKNKERPAIPLVLLDTNELTQTAEKGKAGRLAVFGDSTCLDANQHHSDCFWLMEMLLHYATKSEMPGELRSSLTLVTQENMQQVYDAEYLKQQKVPQVIKATQHLFNQVSRVHNLKHVQCKDKVVDSAKQLHAQVEGDKNADLQHNNNVVQRSFPLQNDKDINDGYRFEFHPHLDGNHGHEIMILYPFLVMAVFMVMVCVICRPARKLLLAPFGAALRKQSLFFMKKVKTSPSGSTEHHHV